MTRSTTTLLLVPILVACSPDTPPSSQDARPEPTPALAPPERETGTTSGGASPATPGEPAPALAPTPALEPTPTLEPPKTGAMRLVALREGQLALRGATILMDGEPLVRSGDALSRGPEFGRGLAPVREYGESTATLAFIGDAQGTAFVTTATAEGERLAYTVRVHERKGERWSERELAQAALTDYYPAYVRRGEAILGLVAHLIDEGYGEEYGDEEEGDDEGEPAKPPDLSTRFVHLAGPREKLPQLPKDTRAEQAVSTSDGTLYALTSPRPAAPPDYADDESFRAQLLVWAPGETKAERVDLQGLGDMPYLEQFSLAAADEVALIGSDGAEGQPYLVVATGTQLTMVDVAIPKSEHGPVSAATRNPSGELWVVVNGVVWHFAGTRWDRVALPSAKSSGLAAATKRLHFDSYSDMWVEKAFAPLSDEAPRAVDLAWLGDSLWVVASVGALYDEPFSPMMDKRFGVFTNLAGERAPTWLPNMDQLAIERLDDALAKAAPGQADETCTTFTLVFDVAVPPGTLELAKLGIEAAELDALASATLPAEHEFARIKQLYLGERAGKRELVLLAEGGDDDVAALQKLVTTATGLATTVDCRPRQLVELVRSFVIPDEP